MSNRLLATAKEAIIDLTLKLNVNDLISFFEGYPEFRYLLNEPHYLNLLSEEHNVPTVNNLDELMDYLNVEKNLLTAVGNNDLDEVNRIIELITKLYNKRIESIEKQNDITKINELVISKTELYHKARIIANDKGYYNIKNRLTSELINRPCSECGNRAVVERVVQMRGSDEPVTYLFNCAQCGKNRY